MKSKISDYTDEELLDLIRGRKRQIDAGIPDNPCHRCAEAVATTTRDDDPLCAACAGS